MTRLTFSLTFFVVMFLLKQEEPSYEIYHEILTDNHRNIASLKLYVMDVFRTSFVRV